MVSQRQAVFGPPERTSESAAAEEVALEEGDDLLSRERTDPGRRTVLLQDADVVLQGVVRRLQRVPQLVALEDPLVVPRLVGRPVLRVDHPPDGPDPPGTPFDPDDDPLLPPRVVDAPKRPLGAAAVERFRPHARRIQSTNVALRDLFSFLFQRSPAEERVAAYVIREHERGRALAEVLEDRYVQNRLTPQQRARLLDRPEVVRAIGKETVESVRSTI
jgi:hypothetical protein